MVEEVLSRTIENLFSWTTVVGIVLFLLLTLLRVAPGIMLASTSESDVRSGPISNGCYWMILVAFCEALAVFYLVVAISPKVLGFDTRAHWLLPVMAFGFSTWTTVKRLLGGMVIAFAATLIPVLGRLQIFLYTMMSILFYRVGYKWSRPDGYRIGNEAYKDFLPETSVSLLIAGTCVVLSIVSFTVGHLLTKKWPDDVESKSRLFDSIGATVFAIIPIYMYGAWFSLKMH